MIKNLSSLFILLAPFFCLAQEARVTSDKVYGSFKKIDHPAEILIISPESLNENTRGFSRVLETSLQIRGRASDHNGLKELRVNNQIVAFSNEGEFITTIPLKPGINDVKFLIVDSDGSETVKVFTIVSEQFTGDLNDQLGKYYALLIGIDEYEDPEINDLANPIKDAVTLGDVLVANYIFENENVKILKNATRRDIITSLNELRETVTEKDNLLIFYAGHGYWDDEAEIGYWIPSNGAKKDPIEWFRNSTLTDQLRSIKSKHTLLIADACFSGGIFSTRAAFSDGSNAINKLYELPSRKAMTSGTLTEVPDRSAFLRYLKLRLEGNSEKYITSESLFTSIRTAVINNSDVIPQYGTIQNVGDQGGEFVFVRRE